MAERHESAATRPVVFDTDVLIWYFRGSEAARRFLARVPHQHRGVSSLTIMELLQGCRDRSEIREAKTFLLENMATVLHPDEAISRRAIDLLERHAAPHGLRVVDGLIAATALESDAVLATANTRHYRAIGRLELLRFRP